MTTMGVRAVSSVYTLLPVGGQWLIEVETTDLDGYATDAAPTMVVTDPDGVDTTLTVEHVTTGLYRATFKPVLAGRHVAAASTTGDTVLFAAFATGRTTAGGMPTADDVVEYMGATSHTLDEVQDALDAEAAAQRAVCRVRAIYPDDLRQALLRRVQRNLALRQLPLAVLQGDAEMGATVLPGRDPEVRRLEAPHRKLVVG